PTTETSPVSSIPFANVNHVLRAPALAAAGSASKTCAPPALWAAEANTPPEGEARGSCPPGDAETESSDSDDDAVGSKPPPEFQKGGDLQQQQYRWRRQQQKEEEEEAMAADELSPVFVMGQSELTPSAFSSPTRNQLPPWPGGSASTQATTGTETQEDPDQPRVQPETWGTLRGRSSRLSVQQRAQSAELPVCGGDDAACRDGDAGGMDESVTGSQPCADPDGSLLTSPSPTAHQSSLVTDRSDQAPRRGASEGAEFGSPMAGGTQAEDVHDEKDSPTGYMTPTGEGEPAALSRSEEEG
ncbi:unnamed protein product, partial [Scytosiphon promiscuus]